jgi:hypothetical protein
MVRGTVVTGISPSTVISSSGRAEWCLAISAQERLLSGVVTWIAERELGRTPHRAAADQWLRTAPSPLTRTATLDRVGAEAQSKELAARHHAVLLPRQLRDGSVPSASAVLP